MSITATELKENLGRYLQLASEEDIFITRNGKVVAKLSSPYQDLLETAKNLAGIISADITLEEALERVKALVENGVKTSDACKTVAKESTFKKGELYSAYCNTEQ